MCKGHLKVGIKSWRLKHKLSPSNKLFREYMKQHRDENQHINYVQDTSSEARMGVLCNDSTHSVADLNSSNGEKEVPVYSIFCHVQLIVSCFDWRYTQKSHNYKWKQFLSSDGNINEVLLHSRKCPMLLGTSSLLGDESMTDHEAANTTIHDSSSVRLCLGKSARENVKVDSEDSNSSEHVCPYPCLRNATHFWRVSHR